MTIVSVSIHGKLQAGIGKVAHLIHDLKEDANHELTPDQCDDIQAMMAGVEQFSQQMEDFPDFSTQTPQQLAVLRHDLRNHLNLVNGFAFVFTKGLGGELSEEQTVLAQQIHLVSKGLLSIVNKIA